jgi:outer membrane biosynthesis protein TonB
MRIAGAKPGAGILLLAGVGLLWLGGCHKNKATTVPAQAQAPTITEPEPAPPAAPSDSTHPEIKPATPPPVPATPPRSRTHHPTRKPTAPPAGTADAPAKEVVPAGSAPSTASQLTPSLTPEEAERTRQGTVQLLAATEANLQNLAQPLSRDQQAMVDEIRSYMAQSRAAMTEGDLVRAHNLAGKAHLLSQALPKR